MKRTLMTPISVWLVVLLATVVRGHPALDARADDARFLQWQQPGPNDSRGPCPGLNTLANHNFISRDGKGITLAQVISGAKAGLNVAADFMTVAFVAGLLSNPDLLATTFDLSQLNAHNWFIEHDASMTREDTALGNQQPLNQRAYTQFMSFFAGRDTTSIETASKAKLARVQDQRSRNPEFSYGAREFALSYVETSLLLQTMSDPSSGAAPIPFIQTFLTEERLPYNESWRLSPSEINLLTLGSMTGELFTSSGETLPEGVNVTLGTPANVFQMLQQPLMGKIEDTAGRLGIQLPSILGI